MQRMQDRNRMDKNVALEVVWGPLEHQVQGGGGRICGSAGRYRVHRMKEFALKKSTKRASR